MVVDHPRVPQTRRGILRLKDLKVEKLELHTFRCGPANRMPAKKRLESAFIKAPPGSESQGNAGTFHVEALLKKTENITAEDAEGAEFL
jgi:hypothetical protein